MYLDTAGGSPVSVEAGVLLGANLEDPRRAVSKASELMGKLEGFRLVARSSMWETDPVGGPPGQDQYVNRAEIWLVPADPVHVVRELLGVEARLGRIRLERWGPRVIDLDLLYLGGTVSRDGEATVPHPRLHERAFALYPLAEVRPGWIHPELGRTVEDLIRQLPPEAGLGVRRIPD
ncbi:MAG: 2-amino-4-hydroxy-6-hydroxymethyldihydropteridine diphosphokinase [Deltaproteobacteria bacterium]|jgi:2-amino-4-hydroxy-6-hydroxymethyldihydropteridine diphosphokinase|nr:2-amino-4-hydroxy-6-hydroxymethyldihydropteridine diphosphokinase [Deltaproteobacteria bacterium]